MPLARKEVSMSDDLKFVEEGLKLHSSVASKFDELLPKDPDELLPKDSAGLFSFSWSATGVMSTVIGAAAFLIGIINMLNKDDKVGEALKSLQRQINEIMGVLQILDRRLDELINQIAIENNRQTLARLLDYLDRAQVLNNELLDQPKDVGTAVRVANEAGVLAAKFLRQDFEIWRWTDVVEKQLFGADGVTTIEPALAIGRFKNVPTLPVYLMVMLVWLSARERVVQAGQTHRLTDDNQLLRRQLSAVSIREAFDKYGDEPDVATPVSIAENIKWRIRAFVIASTRLPVNRTCEFFYDVRNWMNGQRRAGEDFDLTVDGSMTYCTIDPATLGMPSLEFDWENEAGVAVLGELSILLHRILETGRLQEQLIGVFPNVDVYPPATLYMVAQNGDLWWRRNELSSQLGGSNNWSEPRKVATGWDAFTTAFNGGGHAMYGVKADGELLWYSHDGYADGTPRWKGPEQVDKDWHLFKTIFPGDEFVIYGIFPDGRLIWHRHDGAVGGNSVKNWAPAKEVGYGWQNFVKVFSGGSGVIYAIQTDGILKRYVHKGYLDGSPDWEGPAEIGGGGFDNFYHVTASEDGVIYGFKRDGRVLWHRYGRRRQPRPQRDHRQGWFEDRYIEATPASDEPSDFTLISGQSTSMVSRTSKSHVQISDAGSPVAAVSEQRPQWEGPVEVLRNLPGIRAAFPVLAVPLVVR